MISLVIFCHTKNDSKNLVSCPNCKASFDTRNQLLKHCLQVHLKENNEEDEIRTEHDTGDYSLHKNNFERLSQLFQKQGN